MLCAGTTVYSALRHSKAQSGQWVVITGAGGGLGHLAVQLASRSMGLQVVGIDHPSKKDLVIASGAHHFVDITEFPKDDDGDAISERVKGLCDGLGAHAVIVCAASNIAYAQGLKLLRFNGHLVCVGIPEHTAAPIATANPGFLISNQLTISGTAVGNRQDALDVLDLAARGVLKTVIQVKKMAEMNEVFKSMHEGTLQGRVVVDLT